MTDTQAREIRRRLDEELDLERFERTAQSTEAVAVQFFRDLFIDVLHFDETSAQRDGASWQSLPVHEWPANARATAGYLVAEAGGVHVVYVELENLTRTAEKHAIRGLAQTSKWAADGAFLTVFHAPDDDIWHLVTPYDPDSSDITTHRPVLRRYTLGTGVTHRTAATALGTLDAKEEQLTVRLDDAFKVEPVIEAFFEDYKRVHETLASDLQRQGVGDEAAKRDAHRMLTRLLVLYFLQQNGWLGGRQDFVGWFLHRYEQSDDSDKFHDTWLSTLFFEGMARSEGRPAADRLPDDVSSAIANLPSANGGPFQPTPADDRDVHISDAALASVIRDVLERYAFTVAEETPYDIDVAVTPAMLGRIYESLIAGRERGTAGIFYTPGTEVDLICRIAVYEQLCTGSDTLSSLEDRRLADFVFGKSGPKASVSDDERKALAAELRELTVVDPACGSGAFLVGMAQVLLELHGKLGAAPETDLKRAIVTANLHGVDIKEQAIRVAEVRLWLFVIRDATSPHKGRPVLPSVSHTLSSGDSLVDGMVDGESSTLDIFRTRASAAVSKKVRAVEQARDHFSRGAIDDPAIVEESRRELLTALIDERIEYVATAGTTGQRSGGGDSDTILRSAASTDAIKERLEILDERLADESPIEFAWGLRYPEVMIDGGFDVVIGNPPYIRHEDIGDRGGEAARFTAQAGDGDDDDDCPSSYKDALRAFVDARFGVMPHKRSDLYLYFFFRSFDILREGGTVAFVTSNAWLDADYGVPLQEYLLSNATIEYVFENRMQRTFEAADVNTAISIINNESSDHLSGHTSFISVYDTYGQFLAGDSARRLLAGDTGDAETLSFHGDELEIRMRDGWRSIAISASGLWRAGGGTTSATASDDDGACPEGRYRSGKWGKFTRAPTVFFELAGATNHTLTRLGAECEIRRGMRTGANQFFYLPSSYFDVSRDGETLLLHSTGNWPDDDYATELRIPREYWMHRTDDGWIPNRVMKTSRAFDTTMVDPESLTLGHGLRYVLVIDDPKAELDSDVRDYVEWGETYDPRGDDLGRTQTGFPASAPRTGVDWYDISASVRRGDLLPMKNIDARHAYWFLERRTWIDDRLHGIEVSGGELDRRFLAGVLNSTYGALSCEVNGRVNLGQGALDITAADHERTLVPPLDDVDEALKADIAAAFETVGSRPVTSIFDELGASNPSDVQFERVAADRLALDRLVIGELLGFDEETHRRVYTGLLELVTQRLSKANSV